MPETRASLIDEIIEKRQPLAQRIERVINHLNTLDSSLKLLQEDRDRILSSTNNPETAKKLNSLNFLKLQQELQSHLNALKRLEARFSRTTVNIGVVGRARQGKSRLLQSLTGLTGDEIPDGNRLHCTGVRSTIYHQSHGPTYGEVSFHTEESFLQQVIVPYYTKLQLGNRPQTISEFTSTFPSQTLPATIADQAESKAMYEHLRRYHQHLEEYRLLLSQPDRRIDQNQIREYVAQDNLEGERVYTNYLAVREVRIICQFPNQDIDKLALVDMPGLGDTGTGDEQRLIRSLGQDVDIILFVRMPKPAGGDHWADVDVRLYDTACKAIPELPLEEWSFMVLNNYVDQGVNNRDNCQDFLATIAENHLLVSRCFITNCANSDSTEQMLDQVLNYMSSKINDLDKKYAGYCQQSLMKWRDSIEAELNQAKTALDDYGNSRTLFTKKFNELWGHLSNELEELVKEARRTRNHPDQDFADQVEAVIQASLDNSGVPSQQEIPLIEKDRNTRGSYMKSYAEYLDRIRTRLSQKFLKLDGGMQASLEKKKIEIADILADDKVGFQELSNAQNLKFLEDINALIPDEFENLKLGFQTLIDFNVTYAAIVQRTVREFFDKLHADLSPLSLAPISTLESLRILVKKVIPDSYNDKELERQTAEKLREDLQLWCNSHADPETQQQELRNKGLSEEEISSLLNQVVQEGVVNESNSQAQILQTTLENLHTNAVKNCQEKLQELLRDSSHIRYVMIAEFVDRVLWSEGAKDNWGDFLRDDKIATKIWQDFRDINEQKQEKDNWDDKIQVLSEKNNVFHFNFLD